MRAGENILTLTDSPDDRVDDIGQQHYNDHDLRTLVVVTGLLSITLSLNNTVVHRYTTCCIERPIELEKDRYTTTYRLLRRC